MAYSSLICTEAKAVGTVDYLTASYIGPESNFLRWPDIVQPVRVTLQCTAEPIVKYFMHVTTVGNGEMTRYFKSRHSMPLQEEN